MKIIKQLLITVAVLLCSATARAYDFEVDGIYYNIFSASGLTVEVTSGDNKYSGKVIIPSTVTYKSRTLNVTSIGNSAFNDCSGLTNVIIPNSVASIGGSAFRNCSSLTSIVVESDNAKYDSRNNCNAIIETATNTLVAGCKNTTIPNSVTSIGNSAFDGCRGLTNITIPNSVTSIGNSAFENCTSLKKLCVEDGETTLNLGCNSYSYSSYGEGEGLFYDCPLQTIYLGRNLSYNTGYKYGSSPFKFIRGLKSVTIGNSVTSIGDNAFNDCNDLTSITIGGSVTNIGGSAFRNCSGLINVIIPNSVATIGDGAFQYCSGLTNVIIPNSVATIGDGAFQYCIGLTSVTIGNSVATIGDRAFQYCSGLISVTIGNSVATIGYYAFQYCIGLTSVTIPNSVTSIGNYAFYYCSGLSSICLLGETPPTVGSNNFTNKQYLNTIVYVPKGTLATYQAADTWKNFWDIEEYSIVAGDTNGDNKVDVGDVTILIGMILDASLLTDSGDINGDNKVDVGDVTTLVAIILGTNNTPARAAAMEEYNVELSVEGDEQSLTIDATATDYPYSAVQFDVYLPAGVKAIGNMVVGCGNAAAYKEQADGAVRVVIYSPSNTAIANKSASIAIDATGLALGSHPVEVKNIILAAPGRAKAIAWDSTGYITIASTTGIDGVVSDAGNADAVVYDLQGHRVTEIVKGRVYIKNGSKFIAQ